MGTTFEVWIRQKFHTAWTLYDVLQTRRQAETLVLTRRVRDRQREYEIRESPTEIPSLPPHSLGLRPSG